MEREVVPHPSLPRYEEAVTEANELLEKFYLAMTQLTTHLTAIHSLHGQAAAAARAKHGPAVILATEWPQHLEDAVVREHSAMLACRLRVMTLLLDMAEGEEERQTLKEGIELQQQHNIRATSRLAKLMTSLRGYEADQPPRSSGLIVPRGGNDVKA